MKLILHFSCSHCVAPLILLLTAPLFGAPPAGWLSDFEKALEISRREGKPLIADFSTDWCHNCRKLEERTFTDPAIAQRLDQFVKVYVDGDKYPQMVKSFAVTGYPTLVAISPAGQELNRTVGFVNARRLAGILDKAYAAVPPPQPTRTTTVADKQAETETAQPHRKQETPREQAAPIREQRALEPHPRPAREFAQAAPAAERTTQRTAEVERPASAPRVQAVAQAERIPAQTVSAPANREFNFYNLQDDRAGRGGAGTNGRLSEPAPRDEETASADPRTQPVETAEIVEKTQGGGVALAPLDFPTEELRGSEPRLMAQSMASRPPATVTDAGAGGTSAEQLPKPLIRVGAAARSEAPAPDATATPAADSQPQSAPRAQAAGDPLATVRLLQGKPSVAAPSAAPPTVAIRTETVSNPPAAAQQTPRPTPKPTATPATVAAATPRSTPATAAPAPRGAAPPSQADATAWMADGDANLREGRKREARAMYSKIVEADPDNATGLADVAYIKFVSLMVDRDDKQLRQDAYDRITQFLSRFPNSEHKDYYTVIRATLAMDLDKNEEAAALLQDFPRQFPNSRFADMAFDLWNGLPQNRNQATRR